MEPLQWPDELQNRLRQASFWDSVPLIGWFYRAQKSAQSITKVAEQLAARAKPPVDVWSDDPLKVRIARYVCTAVRERYGWPNDHFIPDDPFDVVFQIPFDDLEIVEMVMRFEEELNLKITDDEAQSWGGKTLGEVVAFLCIKSGDEAL